MHKQPVVVQTKHELKAAVAAISTYQAFVIDVETVRGPAWSTPLDVRHNHVTWVGLSTYGINVIIPMGHQIGRLREKATHEMKLPPEEERKILASGKMSMAKKKVPVPAKYWPAPPQLSGDVVFAELKPLLWSRRIKVGHNLKFDLESVAKYYGDPAEIPPGPYEDTLVMQHIVNENLTHYDLKNLTFDMMHCPADAEKRRKYYPNLGKDIANQPFDKVAWYLNKDLRFTWYLWKTCRRVLDRERLLSVLRLEMDLYPSIMAMELTGSAVDLDLMERKGTDLTAEIGMLEQRSWSLSKGVWQKTRDTPPPPLTNVNIKRDALFLPRKQGGQGLRPLFTTPKLGQPVLDQQTLEHYADRNELARVYLDWSERNKVLSTYVTGLINRMPQREGRKVGEVHTSFTQHGAATGRLTSRDPNLQNIPRESDIRDFFVAPPGRTLVVADYSQIELRVLAHFTQDPRMLAAFAEGQDIHRAVAAEVFGKAMEDVTDDERQVGKTLAFAVSYGAGPGKIAAQAGVSELQGRLFLDRYYQRFATINPWKRRVLIQAWKRGDPAHRDRHPPFVTTLLGRRRRLPDLYSEDRVLRARAERQAINHCIQGTAAEIMKIGMIQMSRAFVGTPYQMILTVHDEVVSTCPIGEEEACRDLVVRIMSDVQIGGAPIIKVPLVVQCGAGQRWSECKH